MSCAAARRRIASPSEKAEADVPQLCLADGSPKDGGPKDKYRWERRKQREAPHALYPILAICVLAAVCWCWRQARLDQVFSAPPGVFSFLKPADHTSISIGRSEAAAPFTVVGAPLRSLSAEEDVHTPSGSIPIAPSLAFFSFLFFFAIFLQWLVSKIPVYPPPVSIIWFVFGMAAYGVASIPALLPQQPWEKPGGAGTATGGYQAPTHGHNILQTAILEMRFIDSSVVYYVMMPILLYEATQNINWHKFKKFLAGGLTLAVLGVAIQVGILGVLFYYTCIGSFTQWADHAWTAAFLLAATLSSTDPVAVLSVLNAVNASDKLCTMFDGESLINDGSAVLLFQFFFFLLQGVAETPFSTFIMFVKLLFLGPAFGVAVGLVAYAWLLFFRKHPLTQCLAYITFCYMAYFLAEAVFSLSGPLTAVCYGLFIKAYGHIALDREAQSKHYTFVAALALMANCTIFIVSGIVTYGMMSSVFTREDGVIYWLHLLLTYFYLNASRVIMIVLFLPILRRTGYGLSWKEARGLMCAWQAVLLVWGGLRGGIVLALGLRIERDGDLDADLTNTLSFFISGSVFLILLINGMTFELLYRLLNPYPPKPFRRVYLEAVMRMIDHQYLEDRKALENHWLFKGTDVLAHADRVVPKLGWRKVDRLGNLDIKCPDITQAFMSLHEAAIYSWVVPSGQFQDGNGDGDGDAATSKTHDDTVPRRGEETDRHVVDMSSNGSPAPPIVLPRNGVSVTMAADGMVTEAATVAGMIGMSGSRMHAHSSIQPAAASSASGAVNGLQQGANDRGGETGRETAYADAEVTPSAVSSVADNLGLSPEAQLTRDRGGAYRKRAEAEQVRPSVRLVSPGGHVSRLVSPNTPVFRGLSPAPAPLSPDFQQMCYGLDMAAVNRTSAGGVSVSFSPTGQQHQNRYVSKGVVRLQERQAHSLAARGQGLKQSGSRAFDPKFNLRLIEHATTAADRDGSVHPEPSDHDSDSGSDGRESVDVLEVTLQGEDPTTHVPLYKLTCRGGGAGEVPGDKKRDSRRMVDKALTTLRKVVAPLHLDGGAAVKMMNTGMDLRRSRTAGTATERTEEEGKKTPTPLPYTKSRTGVGLYKPRRSDTVADVSHPQTLPTNINVDVNGSPILLSRNQAGDTRARRFDTDATIVFNDISNGAWEEPRKHKRGLFRLLSGKQIGSRRRCSFGAHDPKGHQAVPSGSSRRSSLYSQGGPPAGPLGDPQPPHSPPDGRGVAGEPRRVSVGPFVSVTEGAPTLGTVPEAFERPRRTSVGLVGAAADNFEYGNGATHDDSPGEGNLPRVRTSLSLGSSESYFELPISPRPHEGADGMRNRRKVLRKEREGELYLMIFNACREMYHRLYHKQCIGGSALLSLNTSLDLSNDFAVGKVRQNPIKAWANVLQEDGEEHFPRPTRANLTGFEYEWSVLQSRLHCLQYQRNVYCCFWRNMPSAFLRSLLNSGACQSDLEQLLAFVDVHEELLDKGGRNMELLMGKGLLTNYKQQILSAKRFVLYIRDCYPDSFRFAVCKVAATLLLNLKIKLVKDTASKGLVLEEDKEKLLQILDEQQFRLSRFRPLLILIRPQACLQMGGGHIGVVGVTSPSSNSRLQSPRALTPEREAQA